MPCTLLQCLSYCFIFLLTLSIVSENLQQLTIYIFLGSVLVLSSYAVARSKIKKPRAAQLIRNLAIADFAWFFVSLIESILWLSNDYVVPDWLCYICSPIVIFFRMASLIWTCCISFDVLLSVNKRKWIYSSSNSSEWLQYDNLYLLVVILFSAPGALLNLIKQHLTKDKSDLGCAPSYESLGLWYEVFFTELLPWFIGFFFNVIVFLLVRHRMSLKAFPQSVRKRRRRIMYHYIVVCLVCWSPTIAFYLVMILHETVPALEIVSRSSLYLTGFFNFLVFGMQDPHLKKSFATIVSFGRRVLNIKEVDKSVMFEESTITYNADLSKNKRSIYKYNKLTKEDKEILYEARPDLDPNIVEPLLSETDDDYGNDVDTATGVVSEGYTQPISINPLQNGSNTEDNNDSNNNEEEEEEEEDADASTVRIDVKENIRNIDGANYKNAASSPRKSLPISTSPRSSGIFGFSLSSSPSKSSIHVPQSRNFDPKSDKIIDIVTVTPAGNNDDTESSDSDDSEDEELKKMLT